MELEGLRREIDALDDVIVTTLARRLQVCAEVAGHKAREGIPVMQPDRVRLVMERSARLAESCGISPELIVQIYGLIIDAACRLEDRIIADDRNDGASVEEFGA
jgi:chorismate mutase-like protein